LDFAPPDARGGDVVEVMEARDRVKRFERASAARDRAVLADAKRRARVVGEREQRGHRIVTEAAQAAERRAIVGPLAPPRPGPEALAPAALLDEPGDRRRHARVQYVGRRRPRR